MININKVLGLMIFTTGLNACASNPNIDLNYYLAKTDVNVKVTRTATCDLNETVHVASSAEITPVHSADTTQKKSFNLSRLSSSFANTDISLSLYEDGRLKGINSTSAGQGEAVIASALRVVSSVFTGGLIGVFGAGPVTQNPTNPICHYINGGKATRDKAVTTTYEGKLDLNSTTAQTLIPSAETLAIHTEIEPAIGKVYYLLDSVSLPVSPVSYKTDQHGKTILTGAVRIDMKNPALQKFSIYAEKGGEVTDKIWDGNVSVAHLGTPFSVPISKAAVFGNQTFTLGVASSGAITDLGYGNVSGAAQLANSANNTLNELSGSTATEEAAELRAQADLIAQQQRLVRCQADPTTCT